VTQFVHRFAGIAIIQAILLAAVCAAQAGSSEAHMQRARQLLGEGKPEAAIGEYEASIAAAPSNIEAQGNLGVLQFFANDCSKALPHLTAALTLDPSQARIQALVGICQARQHHVEEAERNLTAALPLVTNPRIHILILTNLVEIEYARGDLAQASANVAELTKIDTANAEALYLACRIYTDLADSARDALTVAAPDSAPMHMLTAERFINAGDATLAIEQYQEALAKDPSLLGVHYELGEAIMQESLSEGSLNRAAAELKLALNEDPRNAGAEAKLGIIEGIRGNSNLAEAHYTHALSLKADEFNALVGLGRILRARGENEKAAEYLTQASKIDPMDDSIHYQLAQLYRDLGRKADAEQEMKLFATIRGLKKNSSLADQRREAH
jgi:Flp pilus assembly protein TadD